MGNAGEERGLLSTERVAFRGEQSFLIPAEKARGGAEEGKVFSAGAEFFIGLGKRGHEVMMKQHKVLWNVFLAGQFEAVVQVREGGIRGGTDRVDC
jgi:hypothetical protein